MNCKFYNGSESQLNRIDLAMLKIDEEKLSAKLAERVIVNQRKIIEVISDKIVRLNSVNQQTIDELKEQIIENNSNFKKEVESLKVLTCAVNDKIDILINLMKNK